MKFKKHVCPNCKVELDALYDPTMTGKTPKNGDFTICDVCGYVQIFNESIEPVEPTEADVENFKRKQPNLFEKFTKLVDCIKEEAKNR